VTLNIIPIIIMVIGLLMFLLAPPAKAQRIGEIMFFAGLLSLLLGSGAHSLHIQ
jgi:hypothetical protein